MKKKGVKKTKPGKMKDAHTTENNWYKKEEPTSSRQSYRKGGILRPKQGVG